MVFFCKIIISWKRKNAMFQQTPLSPTEVMTSWPFVIFSIHVDCSDGSKTRDPCTRLRAVGWSRALVLLATVVITDPRTAWNCLEPVSMSMKSYDVTLRYSIALYQCSQFSFYQYRLYSRSLDPLNCYSLDLGLQAFNFIVKKIYTLFLCLQFSKAWKKQAFPFNIYKHNCQYAVKVRRHKHWSRGPLSWIPGIWFTLCKFHRRWHSFCITLKSTLLFMRSSNVWTTKPWQRS